MTHRVITLKFDPRQCKCLKTRLVFAHQTAMKVYLLWRIGHIVSDKFAGKVLDIGDKINVLKPCTVKQLRECFPYSDIVDFCKQDTDAFCQEYLSYFTGDDMVEYIVKTERK